MLSGALVTAGTMLTLEILRLLGPRTPVSVAEAGADGTLHGPSPAATAWSPVCLLAVSPTSASLAAAVLARLEDGSGAWHRAVRAVGLSGGPGGRGAPAWGRQDGAIGRDIEVEVKLTCGHTYRGLYGDRAVDRARGVQ